VFARVGVWATDSYNGTPAGTIHRNADDDYGRPAGPACGATGRLFYFAFRTLDDVSPVWRCRACGAVAADG
jgi:hypothetical protein